MKVLYDSRVLVSAFLEGAAINKTGIFRFVENLALGLEKKEEVALNLFTALNASESTLWQNKILELAHLKQIPHFNLYHPLHGQIEALSKKLERSASVKKFFLKSYRESLRLILNYSKKQVTKLNEFDLFFSPYHPAPRLVREKKQLMCINTIHDLIPLKFPHFFKEDKRSFFDRMLKKIKPWQYFFALSESTKADICHYYGISPSRIFVVHSAPTPGLFYPVKEKSKIDSIRAKYKINGPYFLSLATLEPRKNIPFLVDAFLSLIEERPDIELTLVLTGAKGWGSNALLDKIKMHPKRIVFTGFVEDQDLAALYSGAMAFVYPSLYEGFGLPPLEAMSCGVPTLVSDSSSLPEVVGSAGLYADPNHKDDFCEQMRRLYDDGPLREELREKALIQAKKFTWDQNAQVAFQAFKKILS